MEARHKEWTAAARNMEARHKEQAGHTLTQNTFKN
jgi:hypothetical protein